MGPEVCNIQVLIGSDYPAQLIPRIDQAKKSLDIIVFDWRWYPDDIGAKVQLFNQAIIRAAKRGVKVRALVNYDDIVSTLNNNGCQAKKLQDKQLLHSKLIVIDAASCAVGSHNFTQRAFNLNYECSVLLDDVKTARQFVDYFDRLWPR